MYLIFKQLNKIYPMKSQDKVTEIFFIVDEFLQVFNKYLKRYLVEDKNSKRRNRKYTMSDSEIITILILYHLYNYKNFKSYYLECVQVRMKHLFPNTVSYNRFLELREKVFFPMVCLLKNKLLSKCTGKSFVDSTTLKVCDIHRVYIHKTFKHYAIKGKSSMGWFYGFKLHIICNDKGEIINFMVTKGNVDDREPLKNKYFLKDIKGKIYADRGYVSSEIFSKLYEQGIELITKLRSNMKNKLMDIKDRILLNHRGLIESLNNKLKSGCQIEHTRHRSLGGFLTNIITSLCAYHFMPNKPHLKFNPYNNYPNNPPNQLELFPLLIPN